MGNDVKLTIIAEGVTADMNLAQRLYSADVHYYDKRSRNGELYAQMKSYLRQDVMVYTYMRRNYAPYKRVQEISAELPSVKFTILADLYDFTNGPAVVIRIANGELLDGYAFYGMRQTLTETHHPEVLYNWFQWDGAEAELRLTAVDEVPVEWDDIFSMRYVHMENEESAEARLPLAERSAADYGWQAGPTGKGAGSEDRSAG